jgi:hypothetical protein
VPAVHIRFYVDPETGQPHINTPQKEAAPMTQKTFPPGWDEARVQKVLAHYESQSEEEAVAEDEAAAEDPAATVW